MVCPYTWCYILANIIKRIFDCIKYFIFIFLRIRLNFSTNVNK